MKYVLLNFKNFASKNTMMFMLFLLCQFVASFVILLSFGTYQNFKLLKSQPVHSSDLVISFGKLVNVNTENDIKEYECDGTTNNAKVKKFLTAIDADSLSSLEGIFYSANAEDSDLLFQMSEYNNIYFRLQFDSERNAFIPYMTAYNNSSFSCGTGINIDDFVNGKRQIELSFQCLTDYLGSSVTIGGEKYEVCGISSLDDTFTIPFENSPDSLDSIHNVEFKTDGTVMSDKTYNSIVTACRDVFGDYAFIPEIETVNDNLPFYNSIMLLTIVLTALSVITLMLVYRYILSTRNRMISVFRTIGCTFSKARRIFVAEIMLSSIVVFVIVSIIYFKLVTGYLSEIFVYINTVYSKKNYLIMLLIYLCVTYIISNLMIISKIKRSPLEQIKDTGVK